MINPDELERLKAKIVILEEENLSLSQNSEELLLINTLFDTISENHSKASLYQSILEKVAILKDIPFCSFLKKNSDSLTLLASYALFKSDVKEGTKLKLEVSDLKKIDNEPLFIAKDNIPTIKKQLFISDDNCVCTEIVLIPFNSLLTGECVFLLADHELSGDRLSQMLPYLNYVINRIVERFDIIYYQDELRKLNHELEEKVIERTNELLELNEQYKSEIEERKKSVELLSISEKRFRMLFEESIDAIFLIDKTNGKYLDANNAAEKLTGRTVDELKTLDVFTVTPNGAHQRLITLAKDKTQYVGEVVYVRPDGSNRIAIVTIVHIDNILAFGIAHDITERKKTESQIVEREKLYRDLVENINQGYYKANHRSVFIYCNPAISILSGYSNDELLNMSAFRIVLEEDRKRVIKEYTKWATSGVSDSKIEFRICTKEGIVKYVEQQTNIVKDKNGKIIGYSCVLSDITERKLIEKDLIDSEERFRKAFATSPDAIVISEAGTGKYIYVNPGFTALTGYSNEEVIGKTSDEINIFENYSDRQSFVDEVKKDKTVQNFLTKFRIKSGEIRYGSLGAAILELNGAPHLISITRDITKQRLAEKALTDKQLQLQSVISNAPIILFVLDKNGIFILSEGKGLSSLGLKPGQVVGQSALEVYKDFPDIVDSIKSALAGQLNNITHKIDKKVFDANYTPIIENNTEITGVIGVATDITERIRFEETLKTSEENYKYLFENNPQPMWVYDIDTLEFLAVNKYAVNKYGYTKEEFLSMTLLDIRPADEHERLKNAVYNNDMAILKSGYWKHITKDGKILFVEIYSHRLDFMGRNARLVMANDVTERKKFEDALLESEETYRLTAEQTGQIVYDHDMIKNSTRWTGAILNVTGYTEEEFIKDVAVDIYRNVHADDRDRTIKICKESVNKVKNYRIEYRFKHKNGDYIYLEDNAAFIRGMDGKAVRMLGTLTNVNNRKLIENQLRNLSRAVEQSPVSIVVTDIKGNIEYVNPKFEEVSGYLFNEVIGKNPRILSSGIKSTSAYEEMWKTILRGEEWHGEFYNKKKNGELYWESATISPIHNDKNEIEKFIAIKEDVTEQKKLTQELIEAKEKAEEMVKLKSYFFANMSHELRTPFVGILGFAEILKDTLDNREEKEYAEQILKSSKRLTDTLNKILNISRIEFDKVEVKNTQVVVSELLKNIENFYSSSAKLKNTAITSCVEEDNLIIFSDSKLLEDILNNLVSNAVKFTENGSISLSAKRIIDKDNARLIITVTDTGIGIPIEKQSLVWQEFRQASEGYNRSFEGTGLGLTITKKYVELLNGTIALISEEQQGTSFIISLPIMKTNDETLTEKKVITPIKKSEEKSRSNVKPKLLYVEDDAVALEYISIILKSAYDVDTAINAATALEYTAKKEYDILMLDINLGRGMDGVELMQRIREIDFYKNIPMVAVTAYASDSDKNEFLDKGFTHYISKPFTQKELHKLLAEVVNQK